MIVEIESINLLFFKIPINKKQKLIVRKMVGTEVIFQKCQRNGRRGL
jgi:hypothetical protein